jgi:hypothetical protein
MLGCSSLVTYSAGKYRCFSASSKMQSIQTSSPKRLSFGVTLAAPLRKEERMQRLMYGLELKTASLNMGATTPPHRLRTALLSA